MLGSHADLLAAKVTVPALPPGLVIRPRVLKRLSDGLARRVTLVCAGAGWGKTMLVASWADSATGRPVAWLSLDPYDDEPVRFWSYFLASVRRVCDLSRTSIADLTVVAPVSTDVPRRIVIGLAELPDPPVVVLDDVNQVRNPDVLHGVAELLRHPTALRLILISRTDPPLRLQRLRVDGALAEIRSVDLAFTYTEAVELLRRSGVATQHDVTRRLVERTEGWATGLRLAAMYVADGDPDRIDDLARSETSVAEYLVEEVVAQLPPERRRFLQRTSIADRLCGELADLLADGMHGQRELELLEQANAFVVTLGPGRFWFRYHPLMTDLLRHLLALDEPEHVPVLHRRAARWFAARGDTIEAVRHAVRAADWQLVGHLVATVAGARAVSGDRQALAALLAELPANQLTSSAEARVCAAMERFLARDYAGMANHVRQARAMLVGRDAASARPIETFLGVVDMISGRLAGDVQHLIATSESLLRQMGAPGSGGQPAAQYEAPALGNVGVGLYWSARLDEAEPYLLSARGVAEHAGLELTVANSIGYLGLIELRRGWLGRALELADAGLELVQRRGWTELCQSIAIFLTAAGGLFERNDLEAAQRMIDRGIAAQRNDPEPLPHFALQCLQARLWLATGHVRQAEAVLRSLTGDRGRIGDAALVTQMMALISAEISLAFGRPQAALGAIEAQLGDDQHLAEELRVALARAHLALRNTAAAEQILDGLREAPRSRVTAVDAWVLTALTADHARDDHRALDALDRAITLAEPEDIRRPFTGQARLDSLLRHRSRLVGATGFVEAILDDLDAPSPRSVPEPLTETLTDREKVVLSHMARLQTNEEIAAELFVSVNTVKAHARSVYRKLEVGNRRQAVIRGRELGVI